MNILTSENKPTLYNLFIASGISSPGKVILVPAMSEAALIMNCVLVLSFPSTLTLSIVYSDGNSSEDQLFEILVHEKKNTHLKKQIYKWIRVRFVNVVKLIIYG